jgi:putative tryptophan/tyrosine transport system substrate-binding protein
MREQPPGSGRRARFLEQHMRRRDFLTLLGSTAAAWPLAAPAQQSAVSVVGYVSLLSPGSQRRQLAAFRQALNEAGYVEGRNLTIEYRSAEGYYDRLPALVNDLTSRQVAVIVASTNAAALTAKNATTTIPIVFTIGGDAVRLGLVSSISRPGGNITGVMQFSDVLIKKRMELLHEMVPKAAVIAVLLNPSNPDIETRLKDVQAAAGTIGQQIVVLNASSERDFDKAFASAVQNRIGALLVQNDPFFNDRIDRLIALAARHKIPAVYEQRGHAEAGGLAAYGTDFADVYRQVGIYTGRILKGAKPADLPVMQPTKFELVINLKTAKVLGLTVPPALLVSADEVIE